MNKIKELRTDLGMTMAELAVKVGVSMTTIQMWERGVTTPNEQNYAKLKEALGGGDLAK